MFEIDEKASREGQCESRGSASFVSSMIVKGSDSGSVEGGRDCVS